MDISILIIMRSLERILAIAAGCFYTYLGYRLFLDIPAKQNSDGKFSLPGGIVIHLTRVGPGIFFSLFGTFVLLISFQHPIEFKEANTTTADTASQTNAKTKVVEYLGVGSSAISNDDTARRMTLRNERKKQIMMLNGLENQLKLDIDDKQHRDLKIAITEIKLALMQSVWVEKDWGSLMSFKNAIENLIPPPDENKQAFEFYNLGNKL